MKTARSGNISCCFVGKDDIPQDMLPQLYIEVKRLVSDRHVGVFLVGGYGEFNKTASLAVSMVKSSYPNIKLFRHVPFDSEYPAPIESNTNYNDTYFINEGDSFQVAIPKINKYMIENASYIVAYAKESKGLVYEALQFAKKQQQKFTITIINLAEPANLPK